MKNKKKCFWEMCFIFTIILESAAANMTEAGSTQLGGFEIEVGPKEEFSPDSQEPVEEQSPGHEERPVGEKEESSGQDFGQGQPSASSKPEASGQEEKKDDLPDQSYVQTPEVPGGEESTDSSRGDGKQSESHENLPKRSIAQNAPTASPTPTVPEKPKEDSRRQKKRTVLKKEKFLRQIQVRNGEMFVQISFESSQDWYLYSFQVNGREIYYHWEDSWCTGEEIPWQGGENRIDATVRTGDGKIYDMEPWIVLRQMDNI